MLSDYYFISRSTHPRGHATDVDILQSAQENNARLNLTGCLIRGADWFAQALEGETAAVSQVARKIYGDPRHNDILFWKREHLLARSFPGWRVIMADAEHYAGTLLTTMRDDAVHNEFKRRALIAVFRRHNRKFGSDETSEVEADPAPAIKHPGPPQYSL